MNKEKESLGHLKGQISTSERRRNTTVSVATSVLPSLCHKQGRNAWQKYLSRANPFPLFTGKSEQTLAAPLGTQNSKPKPHRNTDRTTKYSTQKKIFARFLGQLASSARYPFNTQSTGIAASRQQHESSSHKLESHPPFMPRVIFFGRGVGKMKLNELGNAEIRLDEFPVAGEEREATF